MPQEPDDNLELFQAHADALEAHDGMFAGLGVELNDETDSVSGRRRARRSTLNASDEKTKTVSLVEQGGVLFWRDDVWAADDPVDLGMGLNKRRRRRRAGLPVPEDPDPAMKQPLIWTKAFPVLEPNKVIEALGAIDRNINPAFSDRSLTARLRALRRDANGTLTLGDDARGPFVGRTLLFVHGTFSNATNMLGEFMATANGLAYLDRAMDAQNYDRVLFFDHATLAVSPVINALELGRAFADSSGQIDVVAHSRGGLVVRWWLEAFGKSLRVAGETPVRAVLAGSPIRGTSLAAPDKLKNVLDLMSNIATFAQVTLGLTGVANPFFWVAGKLAQVVASVTGALAKTPLLDGAVAIVPGLAGQSAVDNNHEIERLRLGPCAVDPRYFAVQSNFETEDPRWKFWKYFRKDQIADSITNQIFPGDNDLVVDTAFMTDFGVPRLALAAPARDFGTTDRVWHCNYFRQPETIDDIATRWLTR